MKRFYLLLSILLVSILITSSAFAGRRCTGSSSCSACTTCSGCKYCNEGGGTCGVCSVGSSPEEEGTYVQDENAYVVPSNETPYSSEISDDSYDASYYEDYTNEEEEKTSYAWVWWTLGIGGLLFVVFRGKS